MLIKFPITILAVLLLARFNPFSRGDSESNLEDVAVIENVQLKSIDTNLVHVDANTSLPASTDQIGPFFPISPIDEIESGRLDSIKFAMEEWKVVEGYTIDQINNTIYESVMEVHRQINQRERRNYTSEDIRLLDAKWQKYKEVNNNGWIDGLIEIEGNLDKIRITKLQMKRQLDKLGFQKDERTKEGLNLEEQLKSLRSNNKLIKKLTQTETENYRFRLGIIPLNVLLFARIPFHVNIPRDSRKDLASNALRRHAIEQINGIQVNNLEIVKEDQDLKRYIAESAQGHALVSDSYQFEKRAVSDVIGTDYYLVQRIEVFPFQTRELSEAIILNTEIEDSVGVYQLS